MNALHACTDQRRRDAQEEARWLLVAHLDALTILEQRYCRRVAQAKYLQNRHIETMEQLAQSATALPYACRAMLQRMRQS